jgi:hypothetical protein
VPLLVRATGTTPVPPTLPPIDIPGGVEEAWSGLQVTWSGGDGSVWELSSATSPVWLSRGGTRGLSMPKVDRYTSESPAVAGSRWRGRRVAERSVFWPLLVYGGRPGEREWVEVDSAFWASLHPDLVGEWSISQRDGTTRRLRCRYDDDGEQSYDLDPTVQGWAAYGVSLVAEDPFWRGSAIVRTFDTAAAQPFYGGDSGGGLGPPLYVSSNTSAATASIDNPGDEPAWPVWTAWGPFTSVSLSVAGRTVSLPITLMTGKSVTVDTRPDRLTAVDSDGNDRVGDLGAIAFAPVPRGTSVPLGISVPGSSGATSVEVRIEPAYHRAW